MRKRELDYAKGVGILLMIVSHCITQETPSKIWMFSFHMPLFFLISGIIQAEKHPTGLSQKEIYPFLIKRCKQLLIPYFVFGLILIGFFQALHMLAGEPLSAGKQMFQLFTLQGIESMWFIPCYMIAEILFLTVYIKTPKGIRALGLVSTIGLIAACNKIGMPEFWILRVLFKSLAGLMFIYIGYLTANHKLLEKVKPWMAGILLILGAVLSQWNGFIGIGALQFQNPVLFFLNGWVTSVAMSVILRWVELHAKHPLRVLEDFGRNSIVIVCTNNLFIEVIRLLDYKFTGDILLKTGLAGSMLFALILSVLELGIIQMAKGKLGPVFGKWKNKT